MSVLIEALTLVVPRLSLDVSYPGGAEGFIARASRKDAGARHVCADDALVAVSFFVGEECDPIVEELTALGLVYDDDEGRSVEMAVVDQRYGPTLPCSWLALRRDPAGYTCGWLEGREPGAMAHPEGWTPDRSRRLVRTDMRDERERMLPLAEQDGIETWLDLATGRQVQCLAHREELPVMAEDGEPPPPASSLMSIVRTAMDARPFGYQIIAEESLLARFWGKHGAYECHVLASEAAQQLVAYCVYAFRVPEARRAAVAEAAMRANCETWFGSFALDFTDGELHCRTALDVEGGALSTTMVDNMVNLAFRMCERHHEGFMRAMWGGVAAGEAEPG